MRSAVKTAFTDSTHIVALSPTMGGAVSSSTTDIERLAAKYAVVPKHTEPFHVFLDVSIDHQPAGRLVARLHANLHPLACENFRQLCCGEGGTRGYAGTVFHLHVAHTFTTHHPIRPRR